VGRVCPHPCETKCNRRGYDGSVAINGLERFIADAVSSTQTRKVALTPTRAKEERVAVIGSGPAGLTAAYNLAELGYGVTVFEAHSVPGGMLTLGIPEYRLPRQVVMKEIEDIQRCGVEIRLNSRVGMNGLTVAGLLRDGYKAVFIATGAHASVPLGIEGQEAEGVIAGLEFLRKVNLCEEINIGKKVVIIGGGYVAVDTARAARRLGSEVEAAYTGGPGRFGWLAAHGHKQKGQADNPGAEQHDCLASPRHLRSSPSACPSPVRASAPSR